MFHPSQRTGESPTTNLSLVRLSVAPNSGDWHQNTFIKQGEVRMQWHTEISQLIQHSLPLALLDQLERSGVGGEGSDSDDEESSEASGSEIDSDVGGSYRADPFEMEGFDVENQVHPTRLRIYGTAISPDGGSIAVFVSFYSALKAEKHTFLGQKCKVLFGWTDRTVPDHQQQNLESSEQGLSTEAKAWSWMYGGGPHVPGYTSKAEDLGRKDLRLHFKPIADFQACVVCDTPLQNQGEVSRCGKGHTFRKFPPLMRKGCMLTLL